MNDYITKHVVCTIVTLHKETEHNTSFIHTYIHHIIHTYLHTSQIPYIYTVITTSELVSSLYTHIVHHTGASNPTRPIGVTVYGTGVDFVVIQWTIDRVEYTPETYFVEYAAASNDQTINEADIISVQYPIVNDNYTSSIMYTFVVTGLDEVSTYAFKIVAVNSNGERRTLDYVYFQTREEGKFTECIYTQ